MSNAPTSTVNSKPVTALIAEDEPLQARGLRNALQRIWPELQIVAVVGDGDSAIQQALTLLPDVLFLDIRMPARSGIEVATVLAEEWPADHAFAQLVFVTAYDQYAVQAFDQKAVDYLLKPVLPDRLARTVSRLQQNLANVRAEPVQAIGVELDSALAERLIALQTMLARAGSPPTALKFIQASSSIQGGGIRVVPIEEVICFQAADKYVRVLTATQEYLIRTPLKDLLPQIDADVFWQVHRNTLVRAGAIELVQREDSGKARVMLRGLKEPMPVSRLYLHRFKAM
jgi:DNA-binding LytR/AlgR family response regulator